MKFSEALGRTGAETVKQRPFAPFLAELINIAVVAAFACGYGTRPLLDLDLGWHLVGGLWILDHDAVPWRDFLGVEGRPWVAYSWLPEVAFASLFRWRGFEALLVLQIGALLLSALVLYTTLRECARRALHGDQNPFLAHIVPILAFLLAMQFLAPVWYLRPQLLSVLLFTILLGWAEADELKFRATLPLAILWANIHVMWVSVPGVVLLYGIFRKPGKARLTAVLQSLLLCGAGCCTPYGLTQYQVLIDYAVHHREAYLLIKEFQPLMPDFGYLFWLFAATGLSLAVSLRGMLERGRTATVILFVATFLGAASQRKYLPFFGVVAGVVMAGEILPLLLRRRSLARAQESLDRPAPGVALSAGGLCLLFALCFFALFPAQTPILAFQQELLDLGPKLEATVEPGQSPVPVLNYFDDGGWLALSLYLARSNHAEESRFKTTIDGRTLVMGEARLREFRDLITGTKNICRILGQWKPRVAVLPKSSPIAKLIIGTEAERTAEQSCLADWNVVQEGVAWEVFALRGS